MGLISPALPIIPEQVGLDWIGLDQIRSDQIKHALNTAIGAFQATSVQTRVPNATTFHFQQEVSRRVPTAVRLGLVPSDPALNDAFPFKIYLQRRLIDFRQYHLSLE